MTGVDSIAGGDDDGVISGGDTSTVVGGNIDTGTNGTHGMIDKNGKTATTPIDVDIFGGDDSGTISQIVGQLESSIESSFLMSLNNSESDSLPPPPVLSSPTSLSVPSPSMHQQQQSSSSTNSHEPSSLSTNNSDNILNDESQQQLNASLSLSSPPITKTTTTTNGSLYNNDDNNSLDIQSLSTDNIDSTLTTNIDVPIGQQQVSNENTNEDTLMLMDHIKNSNSLSTESQQQQQHKFESSSTITNSSLAQTPSLEFVTTAAAASTTNSTTTGGGGKRILLSANSPQPVNSSISNMTQQQQTTLLKPHSSSLTNGTMTPPESPSLSSSTNSSSVTSTVTTSSSSSLTSSIQQPQTITVGQLNAAVPQQQQQQSIAVSQSLVMPSTAITNNTAMPLITTPVTPSLPAAAIRSTPAPIVTTQIHQTSAITTPTSCSPFVMTANHQINNNNNNNVTTRMPMAQKSAPILNLQHTNGGQQPMLIQTHPPTNQTTIRNNHHQVQMPQVSLSNSIVLDPRAQQQAHLQQQLATVSAHNTSNLQFQIVNVNSPSHNPLTVPTAVSAPAGYTVSNIITGTNATTIQTKTGAPMQPRLMQFQNSQVRLPSRASSFPASLTLPGLVRGQAIFVKTENGQMHMVNVSPQALAASTPPTVAGHQIQTPTHLRLRLPTATPPGATSVPTTGPNVSIQPPTAATIRTQLAGSSIVLPATLAAAAGGGNTQVATIAANKVPQVSQLLPPTVTTQMIASNVSIPTPSQITPGISSTPQSPTQSSPSNAASVAATTTSGHPPLRVHTTAANSQANSAAPSQMSPTTAKMKCKNFLSTLIRLASEQPESVATNVKTLIQGLIDDTIQPEDFTTQLQRELNSSEQPCLVPFLKKSLPYLRYSLMKEELKIEGVQPPPPSATMSFPNVNAMAAAAQNLPHIQNISPVPAVPQPRPSLPSLRLLAPGSNLLPAGNVPAGSQIITSFQPPPPPQQQLIQPPGSTSNHHQQQNSLGPIVLASPNHHPHGPTIATHSGHQHPSLISMSSNLQTTNTSLSHPRLPPPIHSTVQPPPLPPLSSPASVATATPSVQTLPTKSKKSSSKSKAKSEKAKKEKEEKAAAAAAVAASATSSSTPSGSSIGPGGERNATATGSSSSFRDDDDINDVAAMGGVNLAEESQRILAGNAEIIGQQIRSCKDEPFLYTSPLQQKLNKIVKRYDLEDCSHDVVALVSHAAEERLKTLVEQLGAIAEHRQENLRNNSNYEIVQDVKAQAQFLQELDRIEKRRHEEQEREVLIKAAKSRSKVDDPDHIAIKARAKEMQRLEMEELRQREANKTALQAIGNPKKRLKTMTNSSSTSLSSLNDNGGGSSFSPSNGSVKKTAVNNSINIGQSLFGSSFGSSRSTIKRYKRVTMKDVLFMMERDRTMVRSATLFKVYAR
ncbi:Transcription initiation factor TFIID subunit 4 [Dermatophagoides farinae]|uniref:Transcription initiation factor TFIID subunit 4 n=1 Tax=Dermatophagoides farinae TaxID=6954 RepID=A0A922HV33_DERFA|nr:Transcription initiation factor TFIID subunit 4 [Dermatophagoides farinae]